MEEQIMNGGWQGVAASIPGSGHIRKDIPCQDASKVITEPRPAVIVCDGRGSAKLSHFGAQSAVRTFEFQLGVFEPQLAALLDGDVEKPEAWDKFCRIMYRALVQSKLELARQHQAEEKDFDFTAAFAVVGKQRIGCFQVGDGAVVMRQNGVVGTVFLPEKGEYANLTRFVRSGGECRKDLQTKLLPTAGCSGIAITSDGPEHLMFHLQDMTPGPIFGQMFDDLQNGEFCRQDLLDYLTRSAWSNDPRSTDDRTVALLCPTEKTETDGEPGESAVEEAVVPQEAEQEPAAEQEPIPVLATEPEAQTEDVPQETAEPAPVAVSKGPQSINVLICTICSIFLFLAGGIMFHQQKQIEIWKQETGVQRALCSQLQEKLSTAMANQRTGGKRNTSQPPIPAPPKPADVPAPAQTVPLSDTTSAK